MNRNRVLQVPNNPCHTFTTRIENLRFSISIFIKVVSFIKWGPLHLSHPTWITWIVWFFFLILHSMLSFLTFTDANPSNPSLSTLTNTPSSTGEGHSQECFNKNFHDFFTNRQIFFIIRPLESKSYLVYTLISL